MYSIYSIQNIWLQKVTLTQWTLESLSYWVPLSGQLLLSFDNAMHYLQWPEWHSLLRLRIPGCDISRGVCLPPSRHSLKRASGCIVCFLKLINRKFITFITSFMIKVNCFMNNVWLTKGALSFNAGLKLAVIRFPSKWQWPLTKEPFRMILLRWWCPEIDWTGEKWGSEMKR